MLSRGFTLIEVLVTLVILMFGLLGIAGLMAKGQRTSFEAYQRHQALALANDMVERMRANRTQSVAYAAGAPLGAPLGSGASPAVTDCGSTDCSTLNLAAYDLFQWDDLLSGISETAGATRVGGIINARGCIEEIAETSGTCPAAPAAAGNIFTRTNRVSVAWQGQDETAAPPVTASTCGRDLYGTETRRRLVSLEIMLQFPCP